MVDDPVVRFERAMRNPQNIRNICTSAHIHHGKCISGNSRLILQDGQILTAKEIYDLSEKKGQFFEEKKDEHTIYDVSKLGINVFSVNQTTGKVEIKPVSMAWKLNGGDTINLKLRNGTSITTTPEHKYVVYKNNELVKLEAKELKLGDRVVCPAEIKVKSELNLKKEILETLAEKNFYVKLKKPFSQELKQLIQNRGLKNVITEIKTTLKSKSFYHGLWQNRLTMQDLLQLTKIFQLNLEKIYDSIDEIYYRSGKQRGQNSLSIKLPQNFANFFYLAGLLFGDGSNKKFIVGKESLGQKFLEITKELGFSCTFGGYDGRTPEIITNQTLVEILNSLFAYPTSRKSHHIKVSSFLNRSSDFYVSEFLSGYFDTDGTVEEARRAISISSASPQMIEDLQFLLLRFGCVSIKNKDTLYITGHSAKNFTEKIGFSLKEKQEKALHLVERIVGSRVCDNIGLNIQSNGTTVQAQKTLNSNFELAFIEITGLETGYEETVYDFTVEDNHNFIANCMFISNTAFTDNLLSAAGFMSTKSAGDLDKGMATWQHADEQERLMTVDAANVSMIHNFNSQEFLINLIDTPGHVDFGGNVTRAMRAIDGTVVLVCASEGIMPQTETVLKQALRERVKPVLFINKVDRLIKEMSFTPEQMQQRFVEIINEFNVLIEQIAEEQFKEAWKVGIQDGSVAFGSARDNWALSFNYMQKKNVNFKDIFKLYTGMTEEEQQDWVWKNAPLHEVILDMAIKHLPDPVQAQKYRIPKIWRGDLESELGKDLMTTNKEGKLAFVVTRIMVDPKSGREISAGRLFSGTMVNGMSVYLNGAKKHEKIQQVFMYNGTKTQQMDNVVAGNVLAIAGISAQAGETITVEAEQPFEELKHIFEPVITKAVEPIKAQDLAKVVDVLKTVAKEDPSIVIKINEETGECLMSGMGELHLEIVENRIVTEKGVQIKASKPLVIYRETLTRVSREVEGKSPNKHNKFYFVLEPMPEAMYTLIKNGDIPIGRIKKRDDQIVKHLVALGIETKEANKYKAFYKGNAFIDNTKGVVAIGEVIELILDGFDQVMDAGPLAREPCTKLIVRLQDVKLHEDSIHRGPAQVYPAIREALREAMIDGGAVLYEPVQVLQIESLVDHLGAISKLISNKRGQLLDMQQEGSMYMNVKAKIPVAETFGLSSELRSATEGRGNFFVLNQVFEKIPSDLQGKTIGQIRLRKGLSEGQ
ncbi:MAG: elongation factor EF-2 [Candidatus Nanoarchaeia archaeon]